MASDDGGDRRSGSEKIRDAFEDRGFISEEKVTWLGRIQYGELLNFWVRGQPNPDRVGGLIEIIEGNEGNFVSEVVQRWDPPFKLQFLKKGSLIAFSWPDGQPSVEATSDKR